MSYTPQEYVVELNKRLGEINFANKYIFGAVADTHATYVNRLFLKGQGSTGAKIGTYSKAYKKRKAKKGSGRGKVTSFVNLQFTMQMSDDIVNSLTRQGNTVVNGAKGKFSGQKLGWNIERYGETVFKLSNNERKELDKDIADAVIKIFKS